MWGDSKLHILEKDKEIQLSGLKHSSNFKCFWKFRTLVAFGDTEIASGDV